LSQFHQIWSAVSHYFPHSILPRFISQNVLNSISAGTLTQSIFYVRDSLYFQPRFLTGFEASKRWVKWKQQTEVTQI